MRKVFEAIILVVLFIFLIGCASTSMVCNSLEASGSAICLLSREINLSPEALSNILLVTNEMMLARDRYSSETADRFVDGIIRDLEELKAGGITITYAQAVGYVDDKFKILPNRVKAYFSLLNPVNLDTYYINRPLTDFDIDLLLDHLREQKAIIAEYSNK